MRTYLTIGFCALTLLLSPYIGRAATISPSTIELTSARGQEIESAVTIINTGASEQVYFLDLLGFTPTEETGTPAFAPIDPTDELAYWIKFPTKEVLVPAQSKVSVPFQVIVPDDVPSGGYYIAITVSTAPTDVVTTNGATIEAKTAMLVFLTVEGETTESLALLEFNVEHKGTTLPQSLFSFRVQNQGNVHLTPEGSVKLKGPFGNVIAVLDANQAQGRVLPDSTRLFQVLYEMNGLSFMERAGYQLSHLAIGPMTAELHLSYGTSGEITAEASIWSTPWELISILVGGLLVLLALFRKRQKKSK
ncbi:hypothetical protein HQ487_03405 [Candidatus Uhrbacteria bacterium]|nr:hypothetical protein [Candidatus Uhrbacteria bacterium]